jgi:polysaccharide biosynthesis transport protein
MQERHVLESDTPCQSLAVRDGALTPAPPNVTYDPEPYAEEGWHPRDYWRAIRKRLWLVAGVVTLVTTLVFIYQALMPDIYQAEAVVQVDLESTGAALGAPKNMSVIVSNPVNDPAYFGTQLQLLSGPALLRRVIKTLDLEHDRAVRVRERGTAWDDLKRRLGVGGKGAGGAPDELPLAGELPTATSREEMLEATRLAPYVAAIQESLEVDPVRESRLPNKTTRLISVSFEHPDPLTAAKIVNTLSDTYVLYNLEVINATNVTAHDFLQQQAAELQAKIRADEERLITYAKSNQILSLDASQNTTVERLSGLNRQLLEAENERKLAESSYHSALAPGAAEALAESNSSQIPGAETTAAAQIARSEAKLAELRQRLAELLVENTEEWQEVKEVKQQIAALETQVAQAREHAASVVRTSLETRYRQALSREQSLRAAFDQQRGETVAQNEAAINYRIIQQEIETNKQLLDGLLQRAKQNDIATAGTQNNVHVINYALVPREPVGPRRLLNVFLALFLSLPPAAGLAVFLEHLDDTIRTPDEVEKALGLPALSLIPAVSRRRGGVRSTDLLRLNNGEHPELLINADPKSALAEAYRHLRTSMMLSAEGPPPQTLVVTSSQPNEGKTTTSINMAVSLAQTGASVLLVDADMHRPRVHKMFGLENERGLSTVLSGGMSMFETLDLMEREKGSGVFVLPAGPVPDNPAELLCKERLRELIEFLKSRYDYILIDSPPIISFTDGVIISSMADGVLLVVHGRKTPRDLVRCSQQILNRVGARIYGIVLNNVRPSSGDYLYSRRYKGLY